MQCPYCHADQDKVIDSRASDGGKAIRRRRECLACGKRFTTYEHIEDRPRLMVVKKDGARVPYDRQKALVGLEKACYKRPVTSSQMNLILEDVEDEIFRQYDREVESLEIGRAIAERLKRVDQVAYVRFASVYKQFRDLDELLDEVREVIESAATESPNQGMLFKLR